MRIFVHAGHNYTDHARHTDYTFFPNSVYDVPDDVALYMRGSHPDTFCILGEYEDPSKHEHPHVQPDNVHVTTYEHTEMVNPPADRLMKVRGRPKNQQLERA